MKIGLFGYDDTCVMAYNPDTKELVGIFDNYKDAGNKLGIISSIVQKTCSRKGKAYSETLKIRVSLRLSRKLQKQEMIDDIRKVSPGNCPEGFQKKCIQDNQWDNDALQHLAGAGVIDLWKELRNKGCISGYHPNSSAA